MRRRETATRRRPGRITSGSYMRINRRSAFTPGVSLAPTPGRDEPPRRKGGLTMTRKLLVLVAAILVTATAFAANKPQTLCPTRDKPIDKTKFVDYQGQRVYFCCDTCAGKFKKDPEATFTKLAKEGIVPENIQKTDPVCGMKVSDKSVKAAWKGRGLLFCSDSCKETFLKDPAKYVKALDEKPASKS